MSTKRVGAKGDGQASSQGTLRNDSVRVANTEVWGRGGLLWRGRSSREDEEIRLRQQSGVSSKVPQTFGGTIGLGEKARQRV